MKSFAFSLFLSLISFYSIGQNSKIDLCEVYQHAMSIKNIDTINYLLQLDSTQVSNYEKMELLSMKGTILLNLNHDSIEKNPAFDNPILRQTYKDMSVAISQAQDENQKLPLVYRRYLSLKKFEPHYQEYKSDFEFLNSKGYKADKTGIALTVLTRYDGEFWLGGELSLLSTYSPPFTVRNNNNQVIHNHRLGFSISALVFGYTRNLESNYDDFNFSILRIGAPLYIDILQFGTMTAFDSNHWYYRPELGIGYSIFHLSAGYTIFFRSQKSKELSNAILSFRIKHTF